MNKEIYIVPFVSTEWLKDVIIEGDPIAGLFLGNFWYPHFRALKPCHLHITSKEVVMPGDYRLDIYMHNPKPVKSLEEYEPTFCRKIIASTDETLGLPVPSKDFIKEYLTFLR